MPKSVARGGQTDMRAQAEAPSARRSDTPKAIRLLALRATVCPSCVRPERATNIDLSAVVDVTAEDWRSCGARGGVADAWRTDARNASGVPGPRGHDVRGINVTEPPRPRACRCRRARKDFPLLQRGVDRPAPRGRRERSR